jgi:hypothetical protein
VPIIPAGSYVPLSAQAGRKYDFSCLLLIGASYNANGAGGGNGQMVSVVAGGFPNFLKDSGLSGMMKTLGIMNRC